ncbi:RNA-directed DNA polymerase [Scheffersomyces stipitis CBS 6054]|uniref:RNA-directed DNA polymerase n=1 Tax=Scheffersomyces stipitis (strain ATCC 58785 / CBS 6054 / NBRC 10063 / NRRL Y-11545) TaxID=322104 RepID=A3LSA5_PICST|nr:RNA-directed DNA polymerase [Scheffersomyces stipitis CBS 6054]ABN65869.2 RNA-directed DNA polymerase [Scheffersomyces stipitis CBS 6054]
MNASEFQQVMSRHSKFNYSISFPSEQLLASKNNFPLWKTRMDQLFEPIGKEFVAYLLPSTNVDTGYTSEDRSAFNSYIEFVLSKTVTEDVRVTLSGESVTGRARWLRLLTLYGTMNHRDVVKYVKVLLTMILNPSLKSKAVKPAIDSLYSFTESYTLDEIKGIQLLATSSAPNLIQNYFHSGSESLTYDDVFQFLAEYEENTTEASTAPSVLAATFSTDSRRPSVDANDPLWNTKCYNCGGRGHRRDVCCSPIRVGKYTGWSTNTSKKRSFNDNERKKQYKSGATANVAVNESAFVLTTTTGSTTSHSSEFIFDSGASIHICHDRSLFWTFQPESGSFVSCAGGVRLPVLGRGSIKFRSADETIVLQEVCYVPECTKNLISVHAAVRVSGSPLTTKVDGIYHPRIGRFGVYRDDLGLSVLDMKPIPPLVSVLSVLHNRLGHPHQAIEQQVLRDNYSLADIEKIGDVTKSCASCSEYKKTRSIPKVSHKSDTTTPLQILHSDVSGPHNTPGISSESYFCVLVDDYSKFNSNQVSFDESIYPFENSPDHAPTTSASTIPMGVSGVPRFSSDVATTSRAEHISSDEHETSSSDHSRAQSPDMHREDSPATPVSISHNLQPLHSSPAASLSSYDSTDSELARMPSNLLASDSTGEDWKQEKESAINEDDKESEI